MLAQNMQQFQNFISVNAVLVNPLSFLVNKIDVTPVATQSSSVISGASKIGKSFKLFPLAPKKVTSDNHHSSSSSDKEACKLVPSTPKKIISSKRAPPITLIQKKKKPKKTEYDCSFCKKIYKTSNALLKHIKRKHPKSALDVKGMFRCSNCGKMYLRKKSYSDHKEKCLVQVVMNDVVEDVQVVEEVVKAEIVEHIGNVNEVVEGVGVEKVNEVNPLINIANVEAVKDIKKLCKLKDVEENEGLVKDLYFASFQAFDEWRYAMEDETHSQYVHRRGIKRRKDYFTLYLCCSRNGKYISRGNSKRRIKFKGSKKAGCKASITACFYNTGEVKAKFKPEHTGHGIDLQHITLREQDKLEIVNMIEQGHQCSEILAKIKENPNYAFITKKHIKNIEYTRCKGASTQLNELINLEGWPLDNQIYRSDKVEEADNSKELPSPSKLRSKIFNRKKKEAEKCFLDLAKMASTLKEDDIELLYYSLKNAKKMKKLGGILTRSRDVTRAPATVKEPPNKKIRL